MQALSILSSLSFQISYNTFYSEKKYSTVFYHMKNIQDSEENADGQT